MSRRHPAVRKSLGLLLLGLGALLFALGAFNSWAARDSLSAGGPPSHGLEAAVRFVKDFGEFLYISVGFFCAGWFLLRRPY